MPFGRLLLALIAGIVVERHFHFSSFVIASAILLAAGIAIATKLFPLGFRYKFRWLSGINILFLLGLTGAAVTWNQDLRHSTYWYGQYYQPGTPVIVTLADIPVAKARSYKATATVNAIWVNGQWQPAKGNILVYFSRQNQQLPQMGARLRFTQQLKDIRNQENPGSFNYVDWCARKNLYHQVYLNNNQYTLLPGGSSHSFQQWLYETRQSVIARIHRYITDPQAAALVVALVVGYREEMDQELLDAYSSTGVVHIIAISGMHLGLIYGLLLIACGPLSRFRATKWLQPVLLLLVLWWFTLLAGAMPSILRSAVMFSFIIIGNAFGKKHNSLNTLAASAFCLLIFNPFFLWDVGFRLSYAAVAGIMLLYKPLYQWPGFENRLLLQCWQLTAMSMAAQVFTFPLLLYHFHQFPNYFLISNLVAVPLSAIILYLGIFIICIAGWSWLASLVGAAATYLVYLLNNFIRYMAKFPLALTETGLLSGFQMVLLYAFLACLCYGLYYNRRSARLPAIWLLSAMLVLQTIAEIRNHLQKKLVVYNVKGITAIEIISGVNSLQIGDVQPQHRQAHLLWGIENSRRLPPKPLTTISYAGKKIAIVACELAPDSAFLPRPVDILILGGMAEKSLTSLCTVFPCLQVIADGSTPLWKIEKWKKDCDSLHLRFHSVPQQGAFILEL